MSATQHARLHCILLLVALCACTSADTRGVSEWLSYGPFRAVRTYRPPSPAGSIVLLLSGDGGWGAPLSEIARRLSARGALVAGVDLQDLFAVYSRDPYGCVSPGADLASLGRYLRQHYALADATVLLIGHSAGATLAYVALAQSLSAPTSTSRSRCVPPRHCARCHAARVFNCCLPRRLCPHPGLRCMDSMTRSVRPPRRGSSCRLRTGRISWVSPASPIPTTT